MPLKHRYMSSVLPAAHHYQVDGLTHWQRPDDNTRDLNGYYSRFMDDVDYVITELKLRLGSSIKVNTVALSAAAKKQIGIWLQEGRALVEREDLDIEKKDRLLSLINKLQAEVDRERTPVHAAGQLLGTICSYITKGYDNLKPMLEGVGLVSGEISDADEEQHGHIPPEPKRIVTPKQKRLAPPKGEFGGGGKNGFDKALDDEIPF